MMTEATSLPDHQLFDRQSLRLHRNRAASLDWPRHGFLFEEVAARLSERLQDVLRKFDSILDLGCHGGAFGQQMARGHHLDDDVLLVSADLSAPLMEQGAGGRRIVADEEFLPFAPHSFDLVASVLSLHWTNDLPGALVQIGRSLKADGLFLGALFGVESLKELKWCLMQAEMELKGGASPRISPFTEVRDAGALLQRAGFALPVTDVDTITLSYESPIALMRELRGMGETNNLIQRQKSFTDRGVVLRACELYMEHFADDDGRIPASFQIIYLTGWAPHESQQKPLARGSGRTSLRDVLGRQGPA